VVSKNGMWPLFATVPGGGMLISWIDFSASASGGDLVWIKPSIKGSLLGNNLYRGGFTNGVVAVVSPLSPPGVGKRILRLGGASLGRASTYDSILDATGTTNTFVSGTTNLVLSYDIVLDAAGKAAPTNGITFAVTPATGVFTGTVPNPIAGKSAIPIAGVLLHDGSGEGFFSGSSESGQVTLQQP